ncbi:Gfo/Idh/MocA family oxidoreductase [Flavicella sp.]|uniref:Gfo/Idh/MocA family protein n=1 Tax=Flavicella sp. TaxID=2957742 RepID=UPI00301968E5
MKIGIGIIGYGSITPFHVKSILELENCKLIAIQSSNEEKRRKISNEIGVLSFASYEEIFSQKTIQLIIICTPSGFHLGPAIAAMQAGKHVVVEKPLEITTARCKKMIDVSKEYNVSLSCIFQNRYSLDYLKVFDSVRSGELGRLLMGSASIKWKRDQAYYDATNWRGTIKGDGGAVLINQGIHTIDQLINLMGKVKTVSGSIRTLIHNIEGEDVATATLEFENGAIANIEASTSMYKAFPEKLEIHGEKGSIILEGGKIIHWESEQCGKLNISNTDLNSGASDSLAIDYTLHKRQLNEIITAIINGNTPPVNVKEAIQSIAVIEGIYRSSLKGEKIDIKH